MLIADIYNTLIDALRADKRGLSCEPDEFNRLIRIVNQEIFDEYIGLFEEDQDSSDNMAYFKVHDYNITLTALASRRLAYGTMPTNYYRVIGKPWVLNADSLPVFVDEVTEYEDADRESDYLTKASLSYPTCRIGGVNASSSIQIKVRPSTLTAIYVSYIRTIAVPYLDYYVSNTTYQYTFLPQTTTAQSIPAGTTYRDGTAGGTGVTKVPITVDCEFDDDSLPLIIAKLMTKIGATLPDQGLQQTGMLEEQKLNA